MKKYSNIEKMMIDLLELGEKQVWLDVEIINNPIERASVKGLYYEGLKRLRKKFKNPMSE